MIQHLQHTILQQLTTSLFAIWQSKLILYKRDEANSCKLHPALLILTLPAYIPVYSLRNIGYNPGCGLFAFFRIADQHGNTVTTPVRKKNKTDIVCPDNLSLSVTVARTCLVPDDCLRNGKRCRQTVATRLAGNHGLLYEISVCSLSRLTRNQPFQQAYRL